MKIFNFLHKKKKTELEIENEITEEIIEENIKEESNTTAIVIKYIIDEDTEIPSMFKICNYHSDMFPEPNSIIWAPNINQTSLLPYKVIRLDFIENPDNVNELLIIVKDASLTDISNIEY
jgi:hypothetical protein